MPYGFHLWLITLSDMSASFWQPIMFDKELQGLQADLRKRIVAVNVEFVNSNAADATWAEIGSDFRRWLSAAS